MQERKITIIGAGIAGIMAARTLQREGVKDLLVIEEKENVGGRVATCQIGEGKADYGAQFLTVRSTILQEYVEDWLEKGWIKKWFGGRYPRYTSVNGMDSLVERLAEGLPIRLQTRVTEITETHDGFQVTLDKGETFRTNALIIAIPIPQALSLLRRETLKLDDDKVKELENIYFRSALVGILTMNESTSLPSNGHVDEDLPRGVERIVDHQKKGISKNPVISVYMNGEWSDRNFLHRNEDSLKAISESVADYLDGLHIINGKLKKWRFAQACSVIHKPYVQIHKGCPLYVAGDPFLRPQDTASRTRFESAFISGLEVGEALSSMLKKL